MDIRCSSSCPYRCRCMLHLTLLGCMPWSAPRSSPIHLVIHNFPLHVSLNPFSPHCLTSFFSFPLVYCDNLFPFTVHWWFMHFIIIFHLASRIINSSIHRPRESITTLNFLLVFPLRDNILNSPAFPPCLLRSRICQKLVRDSFYIHSTTKYCMFHQWLLYNSKCYIHIILVITLSVCVCVWLFTSAHEEGVLLLWDPTQPFISLVWSFERPSTITVYHPFTSLFQTSTTLSMKFYLFQMSTTLLIRIFLFDQISTTFHLSFPILPIYKDQKQQWSQHQALRDPLLFSPSMKSTFLTRVLCSFPFPCLSTSQNVLRQHHHEILTV